MNFIKKKIKGSKKAIASDDDDLDPNLFHVPQVSEGGPEGWVPYDQRIDEESEEWQAFRLLTQRVTDTLEKTQQNLSKIVASSALDDDADDIRTVSVADDEPVVTAATSKPERPPPPRRPPPARPPPPPPAALLEYDLHDDFGFGRPAAVPSILLTAGSLFLDDDDPFDTSFVARVSPIEPPDAEGFDEDDPFVVRESLLTAAAMDPFDALLGTARSKSPNPFLVDEPPAELSSSNPFATTAAASDDSFFADRAAPNPFAPDLLELDFAAPPATTSKDDLFATPSVAGNPFGSFAQPTTIADLFSLDPLDDVVRATPLPPTVPSSQQTDGDPFDAVLGSEPDLFGFDADVCDPFGTVAGPPSPPKDVAVPNKVDFPDSFPAVKKEPAHPPPRPPPPSRPPARPPPPAITVKMDRPGAWDDTPQPTRDPFDAFEMTDHTDVVLPSKLADPFGVDLFAGDESDDKVQFDPIPETVASSKGGDDQFVTPSPPRKSLEQAHADPVFDAFGDADFATPPLRKKSLEPAHADPVFDAFGDAEFAPPPPRKKSLEPTRADPVFDAFGDVDFTTPPPRNKSPEPISAIDLFSGSTSAVELKPVQVSDLPRPPSAEELDTLAPFDLMGGDFPSEPAAVPEATDTFDAFDAKFQNVGQAASDGFDPFSDAAATVSVVEHGFGSTDEFDPFFSLKESPAAPKPSPAKFPESKVAAAESPDSDSDDSGPDFSVFIRPKLRDKDDVIPNLHLGPIPVLAPPPKSPFRSPTVASPAHTSPTPRFNPFDKEPGTAAEEAHELPDPGPEQPAEVPRDLPGVNSAGTPCRDPEASESQESPGSPLFEADDTEPLEDLYPKGPGDEGWELLLRQPSKKKLTSQRFWKKVWVTVSDNGVVHLHNKKEDRDAFQELPLQACYSLSEIGAQQYDAYGKIFTVKLQYVFYRERVGVRPGQISKVTHGQISSLGQLAKLGLPLEHAPQVSQLLKLGSQTYGELKEFVRLLEDSLFHLTVHRDRALTYKTEEVQVTVIDELRAEIASTGVVLRQLARVRVFFLAFITSMPDVEIGLNDITKQGKEVVGRHDIIPVVTEEWIRLEKCEFHSCVLTEDFDKHRNIKCHPPDACFFELMRFRVRPPRNRELPLQVKTTMSVIGNRIEVRADVLVPGCISRKHGQIPCEDVAIRFPLPECWIYLFRVEKHFRYGSVKSASRKPGKIKGLERFMGGGLSIEPSLIEVSTGQAKYEHHHRAIVWRIPRLPKDGQGAYTTQLFVCRMELTSYDQIPEEFDRYVYVEFNMPATTVSHTTVRSVSVTNPNPPEKYVKYMARHEYRVEMEHVTVSSECEYIAATAVSSSSAAGNSTGGSNGSPVPSQ